MKDSRRVASRLHSTLLSITYASRALRYARACVVWMQHVHVGCEDATCTVMDA
jgi:gamma-glutamyl:cysteine ligase YbdK (ATP-grasp superfamily)